MEVIPGTVLRFQCETTSPFHTSRQEYANFIRYAPFIIGSTIRGGVLQVLIETHCSETWIEELKNRRDPTEIARFHRQCDHEQCPVKPFFAEQPLAWFSFGHFIPSADQTSEPRLATRIAIARDTHAVAEGAIVSVESVIPPARFSFDIILQDGAEEEADALEAAVDHLGQVVGMGGLRSIGYGTFRVLGVKDIELAKVVAEKYTTMPSVDYEIKLVFTTPYVLSAGHEGVTLTEEELASRLAGELNRLVAQTVEADEDEIIELITVESVEARLRPQFVGRFSYERGRREHRLVAWPDSRVTLHLADRPSGLRYRLAVASTFGIGEWNNWGFGRFAIKG